MSRNALDIAIDRLYATFAHYPRQADMGHCDHCISEEEVQELVSTPLRTLAAEGAYSYAVDAITLWGTPDDFKHFLPRLMDLLTRDPDFIVDPEVMLGKFRHAKWMNWPAMETEAVRDFLSVFWLNALTGLNSVMEPGAVLCAIGNAEDNLAPYLEIWSRLDTSVSASRLAAFVDENYPVILKKGKLNNAFWEEREVQATQVLKWLRDPNLGQGLERMAMSERDATLAERLMSAAERLEFLRRIEVNPRSG